MGCISSKPAQQGTGQGAQQADVTFSSADVAILQSHLWNIILLCVKEVEKVERFSAVQRFIDDIRQSIKEDEYQVPTDEELACRLLSDTVERENGGADLHFVHKLETEDQVLNIVLAPDKKEVRDASLEVLLQWYVTSYDAELMLANLSCSQGADDSGDTSPEEDDEGLASSFISFAWKGSLDVGSPVFPASPVADTSPLLSPSTPESVYARRGFVDEIKKRGEGLEQLATALRSALRGALRRYSTSHHDERSKRQQSDAQMLAGSEWSRDRARAFQRCRSLSNTHTSLLPPLSEEAPLTVVLDLDETLVYARRGPLWVRPGVPQFLKSLKDMGCEIVCWTASNRAYAGGILGKLDPAGEMVSQCIYSHPKWLQNRYGPSAKDLSLIGRSMETTIIIDNLPDTVVGNEANAIVVENYEGCELHGNTLSTLTKVVADIIASKKPVPLFLKDSSAAPDNYLKYCERSLSPCSLGSIWCYMLNSEPSSFSFPI